MDILVFTIALALFLVSFIINMILLDWMKRIEKDIANIRTTQLEKVEDYQRLQLPSFLDTELAKLPKHRTISILGKEIFRKEE